MREYPLYIYYTYMNKLNYLCEKNKNELLKLNVSRKTNT